VLPLTGSLAGFGEESLEGVLLAAGIFDAMSAAPAGRMRIHVRDSGAGAAAAAAAVRELAADPELVAIVGPLSGEAAEAAAWAAEEVGVPLLALSGREEVARAGRFALRVGLVPRIEAAYLADYAVGALGARRVAILYPEDAYGLALRAAFWDAATARGAEVVAVARYAVGATDFAEPIRRLIGYELLSPGERAALAERDRLRRRARRLPPAAAAELREEAAEITGPGGSPLPPFVDFDALFIPYTHERVALIAPHLAFHEVQGVRLLGTSGWNHPHLIAIGGPHVEGAVFTAPFFGDSERPLVAEFRRRFEATFGRPPGFLAAQAFDATNLVLLQLVQGRRSRETLLEGLLSTQHHPGVSGPTSLRPDGNALRRPHLLGIERGRIVSVDERGEPPFLRVREGSAAAALDAGSR
jgi:branched-chain amino acid transport system substrate-binding protein